MSTMRTIDDMVTMNGADVLREMKSIRNYYELQWKGVARKYSWTIQERKNARAAYERRLEALDRVITMLLNREADHE